MKTLKIYGTLILIATTLLLMQCRKADNGVGGPPITMVTFEIAGDTYAVGCPIAFTNTTQNAASFEWDFGDGTGSVEENPIKSYSISGEYTVSLTVTIDGDRQRKEDSINVDDVNKFIQLKSSGNGQLESIMQMNDDSYIVAGWVNEKGYYAKVNESGDINNPIDQSISLNGDFTDITPTNNNGYLIVGNDSDNNAAIVAIKGGGSSSPENFSHGSFDSVNRSVSSVVTLPNGNFVLTGYERTTNNIYSLLVWELSNAVFPLKRKTFGNEDSFYSGREIITSRSGGYVIVGQKSGKASITKINDAIDNVIWEFTHPIDNVRLYCIAETPEGGFILGGSKDSHPYLLKINSNGNLNTTPIWEKEYDNFEGTFKSMVSVDDEYYVIAGETTGNSIFSTILIAIDKNRMELWSKIQDFDANGGHSITKTNDCGYAVSGFGGLMSRLMIMKTDGEGNAN